MGKNAINLCRVCINRNELTKKGYDLQKKVEELPASDLQTEISKMVGKYVHLADRRAKKKFVCLNRKCDRYKYLKKMGKV